MQESTIIRGWRKEGRDAGLQEGTLLGMRAAVVNALQARFPGTLVPESVRAALEKSTDVQKLTDWHREAILTVSVADFERLLTSSAP